jgi:putative transposase
MKRSRFTDSQIIAVIKQSEAGTPVPTLCREHGISSATFYKWRSKYGGMDTSLTLPSLRTRQGVGALHKANFLIRWAGLAGQDQLLLVLMQ